MNKKDMKFIGMALLLVCIGLGIFAFLSKGKNAQIGIVEYKEKEILTFDLNENKTYSLTGSYGKMTLEVKDSRYRVIDVECPNHNCEQMGWKDADSLTPIVCIPNEIIIYSK